MKKNNIRDSNVVTFIPWALSPVEMKCLTPPLPLNVTSFMNAQLFMFYNGKKSLLLYRQPSLKNLNNLFRMPVACPSSQEFLVLPATGGLSIVDRIKNSLSPGPLTSKDSTPEKEHKVGIKLKYGGDPNTERMTRPFLFIYLIM